MTAARDLEQAEILLRSGKLHKLDKSLLRSAVERARTGDASGLAERLARVREKVAKQDEVNRAEAERDEREEDRMARCYVEQFQTAERVRKELGRLERERTRYGRSKAGGIVSFGGTHDPMQTVMLRRTHLRRALEMLANGG